MKLLVCSGFHRLLVFLLPGKWVIFPSYSFLFTLPLLPHPQNQGWLLRWINSLICTTEMLVSLQRKHLEELDIKKEPRWNHLALLFGFPLYIVTMSSAHGLCNKFLHMFVLSILNLLPLIIVACPSIPVPENRMNNHLIFSIPLSEMPALASPHRSTSCRPQVCRCFLMLTLKLKVHVTNYN